MPTLREVQVAFSHALLGGDEQQAVAVVRGDGLTPGARLQIYRHHVFTTLTAALQATYPVVCRLVDERFFGYAADQYIRANPPGGPCLFEYGASFPEFLAGFEPCRRLRYLPDVARLEWALNAAVHAEDAAPLDPAVLRRVPVEHFPLMTLRLDPSLSLLSSPWPIDRIWHANQPDADPAAPVDPGSGGVCLEVRRVGDDAVFRAIDPATHAFRRALTDARCLEEAAAAALDVDGVCDLTRAFQALLEDKLLVDFAEQAGGDALHPRRGRQSGSISTSTRSSPSQSP